MSLCQSNCFFCEKSGTKASPREEKDIILENLSKKIEFRIFQHQSQFRVLVENSEAVLVCLSKSVVSSVCGHVPYVKIVCSKRDVMVTHTNSPL